MLLIEKSIISLYNYQGRLVASPRWPNMKPETIRQSHISISNDTVAVRDASDEKSTVYTSTNKSVAVTIFSFAVVHIVDLTSNRNTADASISVQHNMGILQVALDQSGPSSTRMIAILDKARDLYIVSAYSTHKNFLKLGICLRH